MAVAVWVDEGEEPVEDPAVVVAAVEPGAATAGVVVVLAAATPGVVSQIIF